MSYKKFREKVAEHYTSSEGMMTRADVIRNLESFIMQRQGEGQDFFDRYEIWEERKG